MKKKKYLIIGGILVTCGLLIAVFSFTNKGDFKKIKGDVTEGSASLNLSCDKTSLELNETTTCSLTLNTSIYRTISFQGLISSSSNITISNVVKGEDWQTQDSTSPILVYYRAESFDPGVVPIATFNMTATAEGTGYVKIGKQKGKLVMSYEDGNLGVVVNLDEKITNISVGDSTEPSVSHDASLKHLYVNDEDVLETLTYTVDSDIELVTIEPECNSSGAVITGGGIIPLNYGNNNVPIIVLAEDGFETQIYNISIYRTPSSSVKEDFLSSLSITPGTINEEFSSNKYSYTATVSSSVNTVTINAEAVKESSTVTGTGEKELVIGDNFIAIDVTSSDGVTNEYMLVITRSESSGGDEEDDPVEKSTDASIKSITVDGIEVDLNTLSITLDYMNNDIVEVIVTPNDSKAIAKGDIGDRQISVGENILELFVEAEDGTRNIFNLTIIRKNKEESGGESEDNVCQLTSDKYKIDNVNLKILNVNIEDSIETIRDNIKTTCGTITITKDKVVLVYGSSNKKYIIERSWYPKTGNDVIKYWIIFGIFIGLVVAGIVIKLILNKKQK